MSGFCNLKGASYMLDVIEDFLDMVLHYRHSVEAFFNNRGAKLIVVVKMYGLQIQLMKTSVGGEFVDGSGCGMM